MSAQQQRGGGGAKYDTGDAIATMEPPMTEHAIDKYIERLPDDAVRPPVAWRRGEDIQHPAVVDTLNPDVDTPTRVRVYNHNDEYLVVFILGDKYGEEQIMSVYNGQTHEHGPTRAYLYSHGPHYRDEEVDTDDY